MTKYLEESSMEKRIHPRLPLKQLSVDASDGFEFFQGTISDVSRSGLCISDLPRKLNDEAKIMTIIVRGRGKYFEMTVHPRWSNTDSSSKSIGVEIPNPSKSWAEFVMKFEPKPN